MLLNKMSLQSRRLLLAAAGFVGMYLLGVGFIALTFWGSEIDLSMLNAPEAREGIAALKLISATTLGLGCAALATLRLAYTHPVYHGGYAQWLVATPWQRGAPLPLGSPLPGWIDFVLLGFVGAIASTHMSTMWVAWVVAMYPIAYAALALLPLIDPMNRPLTAHLVTLLLLASVLITLHTSWWAPLVVTPPMLMVAWHGVARGLDRLTDPAAYVPTPDLPKMQPYLSGVEPIEVASPIRWPTAIVCCAFVGYWVGAVTAVSTQITALYLVGFFICMMARLGLYMQNCRSPLSLWDRLRQWRWVVPCYDVVFAAPILAIAACPVVVLAGLLLKLPGPVTAGLTAFVTLLILVKTGPSRRRWKLTGCHRVVTEQGRHR